MVKFSRDQKSEHEWLAATDAHRGRSCPSREGLFHYVQPWQKLLGPGKSRCVANPVEVLQLIKKKDLKFRCIVHSTKALDLLLPGTSGTTGLMREGGIFVARGVEGPFTITLPK